MWFFETGEYFGKYFLYAEKNWSTQINHSILAIHCFNNTKDV